MSLRRPSTDGPVAGAFLDPGGIAVRLVELGARGIDGHMDEAAMQETIEILRADLTRLLCTVERDIAAMPVHHPDREIAALRHAEAGRLLGTGTVWPRPAPEQVAALARWHLSLSRCHDMLQICLRTPHPPLPLRRPGASAATAVLADGEAGAAPRCCRCGATTNLKAVPGAVVSSGAAPEGWRCRSRGACWERRGTVDGRVGPGWSGSPSVSGPLAAPEPSQVPEVSGAR